MATLDLLTMVRSPSVSIAEIANALDAASPAEALEAAYTLGGKAQRLLYEKAAASPPVTLADFVPGPAPGVAVRHFGWNTLPMPARFRRFEKPFCRPEGGGEVLFGYNVDPFHWFKGPGYFVAAKAPADERGAVVIDYARVPDGPVASGWPPVKSNARGTAYLVHGATKDYMRKVSARVTIGAAYTGNRPLGAFFVLVRQE
jgi:hypothetical protein